MTTAEAFSKWPDGRCAVISSLLFSGVTTERKVLECRKKFETEGKE